MNKKIARYALWFYLVMVVLFFLFPAYTIGNTYVLVFYLVASLVFLYFIFWHKPEIQEK
jgi:hypothetical protein